MSEESNQSRLQELNKALKIHKVLFFMTILLSCPLFFLDVISINTAKTDVSVELAHSFIGTRLLVVVFLTLLIQVIAITRLIRVKQQVERGED